MPPKSDLNKAGVETSDFPILCGICLGPNPYVRMSQQPLGCECKICTRPFTLFKWSPGPGMRMKKTEICQTCAKSKNVCQTCILDLQFGLPTQVRDMALAMKAAAPTTAINREYYAQNIDSANEDGQGSSSGITYGKADSAGKELLKRLARADPYYKRNRPHLCGDFAKGSCPRGDTCPYRHELPSENGMARQNIQDRYHGNNDPVAQKILGKLAMESGLAPPPDENITSLFVTSLPATATDDLIRSSILSLTSLPPAAVKSVIFVQSSKVAFINFSNRKNAELAAVSCATGLSVDSQRVVVQWGRSRPAKK